MKNLNSKKIKPDRVVVIGSNSFIGKTILKFLKKNNIRSIGLNRKDNDLVINNNPDFLNFLDENDAVIFISADAPCRNTSSLRKNILMLENTISAINKNISHFVYISSDAVYKDSKSKINEESCCQPNSLHGVMHLSREIAIQNLIDCPICILRPTLVYGLEDPHNGYGPNMFRRLVYENKDIVLFGKGEELRDHIFVDDIAKLLIEILCFKTIGIINAVSGEVKTFKEIATLTKEYLYKDINIIETERTGPIPHDGYRAFDNSKVKHHFQNFKFTSLKDGIYRVIKEYLKKMSKNKQTVGFLGMSHLGLVTSVCLAEKGFKVKCFDNDSKLIEQLKINNILIKEPNLTELLKKNRKNLSFIHDLRDLNDCEIIYVSLDIKTDKNGISDLKDIDKLLKQFKKCYNDNQILIILSQVPPGFTRKLIANFKQLFYQVETLIFGEAVNRSLNPERLIVGTCNNDFSIPKNYRKLLKTYNCPINIMSYESAELTKISINLFLISSVATTNTISSLCEKIGADWNDIIPSLRMDKRIGRYAYLRSGLGISGGNLERDLQTFKHLAKQNHVDFSIINAFKKNSVIMKDWPFKIIKKYVLSKIKNPTFTIWGLSYKPNTNSTKNSPSIHLIKKLKHYDISVFDPVVKWKSIWHPNAHVLDKPTSCFHKSDVLLILTEWEVFKKINYVEFLKKNKFKIIIDPFRLITEYKKINNEVKIINLGK